jgi:Protein of unknown function (DUF3396).
MENRNWDEFRYLNKFDRWFEDAKHDLCEENLQPGLIVYIYFTYTDTAALLRTYRQVLDLLGDTLLYHDTGNGHPTRIRDREKALVNFPDKLENPKEKFIWHSLHDFYAQALPAKGRRPVTSGGLGHTEFSAWIHKFTPEKWLKELKSERSTPASYISIRMPTDQFADAQTFLNWVLSLELLQSPSLFSASAGYCMLHYAGNCSREGYAKLGEILAEHPGFYYHVGGSLAQSYSAKHKLLKPLVARVNWLNALGNDAFLFYPGGQEALWEAARKWPELTLHTLPHGFMVQAGAEPGIGDDGRAPEAYYEANKLLELFSRLSSKDEDPKYPDWALHFYTPEMRERIEERARLLAGMYIE